RTSDRQEVATPASLIAGPQSPGRFALNASKVIRALKAMNQPAGDTRARGSPTARPGTRRRRLHRAYSDRESVTLWYVVFSRAGVCVAVIAAYTAFVGVFECLIKALEDAGACGVRTRGAKGVRTTVQRIPSFVMRNDRSPSRRQDLIVMFGRDRTLSSIGTVTISQCLPVPRARRRAIGSHGDQTFTRKMTISMSA